MFKNIASQSIALFAFDTTTGLPKTGDAANMLFYLAKDWGSVTAIAAASGVPTEMDATNAKGWYKIAVTQTESNADAILFSGKSSTANISVVGLLIQTLPAAMATVAGAAGGLFIAGTNAATTITTALTTTFTGSLTGSVASVTAGVTLAAAAVQAIWDALTSALTTAGSIGKLIVDNLNATISSRLASASYTTPPTANQNADGLLARNVAGGSSTGRTVASAFAGLRNRVTITGGVITVYDVDDTTPVWDGVVTTAAGNPLSEINPS